ncbi:MAG: hypothetical protein AAF266_08465 [Planctomycetota bacterium]
MDTQTPAEEVFAIDLSGQFHPIRLPAEAFEDLHRQTLESLRAFIKDHRQRFPRGPKPRKPKPR